MVLMMSVKFAALAADHLLLLGRVLEYGVVVGAAGGGGLFDGAEMTWRVRGSVGPGVTIHSSTPLTILDRTCTPTFSRGKRHPLLQTTIPFSSM